MAHEAISHGILRGTLMQLRAQEIVPFVAFAALVAIAALWSGAVRSGGEAQVCEGTQAYLHALEEGRYRDAAAFHAQSEADPQLLDTIETEAALLDGLIFVVTEVVDHPEGGLEARIAAVDPSGAGQILDALKLRWAQLPGGRWVVR
jgi:hypothetical protein